MTVVRLDCDRITDWASFHAVFAEVFGFPGFYGRNMNAWIDCMSYLDEPSAGMSTVGVPSGGVLTLQLDGVDEFAARCQEQYAALIECAGFVNWRRSEAGEGAMLALAFHKRRTRRCSRRRGHDSFILTIAHRCPAAAELGRSANGGGRVRRGVMNRLIFLDIDGVLNSARYRADHADGEGVIVVDGAFDATAHIDPERVGRLNRLIAATGAEVVLSSSWRKLFGLDRTQASLRARGFVHRLSDETVRLPGEPRHVEIALYLAGVSHPHRYVILDDAEEAGVGFGANFIHVPDGLDEGHIERTSQVLLGSTPCSGTEAEPGAAADPAS